MKLIMCTKATSNGGLAQLGERLHGMQKANGSIPLSSTKFYGLLVIVVAHVLCKHEAGVRFSHGPPSFAPLVK